jgi:hypothetical protein
VAEYFMHLRDGTDEVLDEEGVEYATLDLLRQAVMLSARDILSSDMRRGVVDLRFRIDAEDTRGEVIYSLPFKHAFNLIPEMTPG